MIDYSDVSTDIERITRSIGSKLNALKIGDNSRVMFLNPGSYPLAVLRLVLYHSQREQYTTAASSTLIEEHDNSMDLLIVLRV